MITQSNPTKRPILSGSQMVLLAVLSTMLVITVSWALSVWMSTNDVLMTKERWHVLGLGIVLSLPIGGGIIALMFYSKRHGYDEVAAPKAKNGDV